MFSFRDKIDQFYDWPATDIVLFDDLDPERRAIRSAEAHGGIWEPIFRGDHSALHAVSNEPQVALSGDLAALRLNSQPVTGGAVRASSSGDWSP